LPNQYPTLNPKQEMGITGFSDFASTQKNNYTQEINDQENTTPSDQPIALNADPQQL